MARRPTSRETSTTGASMTQDLITIPRSLAAISAARTTKLYDRRDDEVSLDEYERVGI
jgi:hypothetical protein